MRPFRTVYADHVTLTVLLILALASARVTRLIVTDTITMRPRAWAVGKAGGVNTPVGKLLTCGWCTGFWVSVVVAGSWWWWHPVLWVWLLWAVAYGVGLLLQVSESMGRE